MMATKNYSAKDIKHLEGIEAIRLRPGMYIGSIGSEGLYHIVLEILSNSIDEWLNGYCKKIFFGVNKNSEIKIADDGRGIPVGVMEDGSNTLVSIFTKLHTGAKFTSDGSTGYNTSGGMNGQH
jgi:DNA gyrase subunit B